MPWKIHNICIYILSGVQRRLSPRISHNSEQPNGQLLFSQVLMSNIYSPQYINAHLTHNSLTAPSISRIQSDLLSIKSNQCNLNEIQTEI